MRASVRYVVARVSGFDHCHRGTCTEVFDNRLGDFRLDLKKILWCKGEIKFLVPDLLVRAPIAQGQHDDAIVAFNLVITKFGIDRWNSVALLGMGRCFQAQGKAVQARAYFDDVILKHPNTAAAEVAADLLKKSQ